MVDTENFAKVPITNAAQLRSWLEENHGSDDSVWLVTFKTSAGRHRYVSREEVLDELIAFGWIDGIRRKLDDDRTMQLISKRRQQKWAESYANRAERLTAEGRMHPAGLKSVEDAKRDGNYRAMPEVDALMVPKDMADALDRMDHAAAYFHGCPPSYRRNLLRWLASAKKPETRVKRIETITGYCERGERIPNY